MKAGMGIFALGVAVCLVTGVSAAELSYSREETTASMEIGKRTRVLESPLMLVQPQFQYGLWQNYLNHFVDRPLFYDRAFRTLPLKHMEKESLRKDLDLLRQYEINGWAGFVNYNLYLIESSLRWMDDFGAKDIGLSPNIHFLETIADLQSDAYQSLAANIKKIKGYPNILRVNGKTVCSSYVIGRTPGDREMKTMLAQLRKDTGVPLSVMAILPDNAESELTKEWKAGRKIPSEKGLKAYQDNIQSKLDVFDGVVFRPISVSIQNFTNDLPYKFDRDAFPPRVPAILEVLKRPGNHGKWVGVHGMQGYINPFSGLVWGEYGTTLIRQFFDNALLLNPDYLLLTEWNEFNENTCIQPTLSNSMALQRLVKYYMRTLRGEPATPNRDDDRSIPNLVLSHRQFVRLGEILRFELLNIPDADTPASYRARLLVRDAAGKVIQQFPWEEFAVKKLTAITYKIPTEQLADHRAVCPEVEIMTVGDGLRTFTGFQYVQLDPTVCWNYKEVRMPLRDLLRPVKSAFTVGTRQRDGTCLVTGTVEADEPLASLEVLDQNREIFAVDPEDEFKLQENVVFWFICNAARNQMQRLQGEVRVRHSSGWIFSMNRTPWQNEQLVRVGDVLQGNLLFNYYLPNGFFLSIPKKDIGRATVEFAFKDMAPFSIPIKAVCDNEKVSYALPKTARIDAQKMLFLADVPVQLQERKAQFTVPLKSVKRNPVFHMRAVTRSGKIYRSAPVVPPEASGKSVALPVFSDTRGKPVVLQVAADRVPDLIYTFTPAHGAMLRNSCDPFWDGKLGGGFIYGEAFCKETLPDGVNPAPSWKKINRDGWLESFARRAGFGRDDWALEFSGDTQYISFPRETFPQAAFTIELEARFAEEKREEVIFRHVPLIDGGGSLHLFRQNDTLSGAYFGRKGVWRRFNTGLPLPAGEWLKIGVANNLQKITFTVNGTRKAYDFQGERAGSYKPAVFGGPVNAPASYGMPNHAPLNPFKGQLRAFRITHNAE